MKASKHRHRNMNSKRRTRKTKGGSGMGVEIRSASGGQYINPMSVNLCPGCASDNTTAGGAYSLNTPLPMPNSLQNSSSMVGGSGGGRRKRRGKKGGGGVGGGFTCNGCGQMCNKSPFQFLQSGGGKGKGKGKRSRKMGGGGFWDFAKPFWNPSNPGAVGYENGYKVLAPSCKGISPSGLGSPASTSGYEPDTKPWSAQFRDDKHLYQRGGGKGHGHGPGRRIHKNRSRKLKGGNVFNDIFNFGRTAVHGVGTTFNNFRGVSNEIYTSPPNPLFGQFPRGYGIGGNIANEKQFMDIKPFDIKGIYSNATSIAAAT